MPAHLSTSTRGALCGLAAAALFGLSAPLAKPLLQATSPLTLAGLLYVGGGLALAVASVLRGRTGEAALQRSDVPRLGLLILFGGILGPVLMLLALQRTSASSVSLLLNLEGPFTLALAALAFGEHVGWRGLAALLAVVAGAVLLGLPSGPVHTPLAATLCVAGACLAWGLDNNLTRSLSLRDPVALVREIKLEGPEVEKQSISVEGYTIRWKGFGRIFLGEVVLRGNSRQVTLVRLAMGSSAGGPGSMGCGKTNGQVGSS